MLFGHVAVGMAAKPVAPKVPLGALILSATTIDILCGAFMVVGLEKALPDGTSSIPYSHGLFMSVVWSVLAFAIAFAVTRDRRSSLVIGLLVFSHWVLDFISHPMGMGKELPPDLPLLFEGSTKVGLGLYNSAVAGIITEFGLYIAGIVVYLMTTRAVDRAGKWGFWLLVAFPFLAAVVSAIPALAAWGILSFVLIWPLGNWVDRHRVMATAQSPQVTTV